jgi:hypothetical protein
MLDKMQKQLPSYHDHVLRLRQDCPDVLKRQLSKALSFVYTEILQFCQDACLMLKISPSSKFWLPPNAFADSSQKPHLGWTLSET